LISIDFLDFVNDFNVHLFFRCDFGFTGSTCNSKVVFNPMLLMENFEDDHILTSSSLLTVKGATISYMCGVLSSGKALVFNKNGQRFLLTSDFNTTNNRYRK